MAIPPCPAEIRAGFTAPPDWPFPTAGAQRTFDFEVQQAEARVDQPEVPTCGAHEVVVTSPGGDYRRWWIPKEKILQVKWERRRDEATIGSVFIGSAGCEDELELLEPWLYEIHIHRSGHLVWTGIITRIEIEFDQTQIFAQDILAVAKRRVLSRGYNYETFYAKGSATPVSRAHDVIEHVYEQMTKRLHRQFKDTWRGGNRLWPVYDPGNPTASNKVNAKQISVYQDLEYMAQRQGLDYTTWTRDLYWWDNSARFACLDLPDLAEEDISTFPRLTFYGSEAATRVFRTDGSGYSAKAAIDPALLYQSPDFPLPPTGPDPAPPRGLDLRVGGGQFVERKKPPQRSTLQRWRKVAQRHLDRAEPPAERITVPDGSTLMPSCPWDIKDVLAGSYFNITVSRYGKPWGPTEVRLDRMIVTEKAGDGETIQIYTIRPPLNSRFVNPTGDYNPGENPYA